MSIRPLHIVSVLLICSPLLFLWHYTSSNPQGTVIKFWNGNKTSSRQAYERDVLHAALEVTRKGYGEIPVVEDVTDYPDPADEAAIFRTKGFDVFGTVAGNPKLAKEDKILIPHPMMKGLLGYRLLIIRTADRDTFAGIRTAEQLQQQRLGIPFGWADAALFRHNKYPVVEEGTFDDLFTRLRDKQFDYVSFGANEVEGVYQERAAVPEGLQTDEQLLLYYPFPLVFYVNPENKELARRIDQGMQIIIKNGELDKIFQRHYGNLAERLQLKNRQLITLKNPLLPDALADYESDLLSD